MVDLRKKVEEDRGLIKKIELLIPGFRGYRKREDLRIADSLLRSQLADRIRNVRRAIESCRESLTKSTELEFLEDAGGLVNQIAMIEEKIRHAEQGYTGVSPDYRIEEDELNRLYEWDLSLIGHIEELDMSATLLQHAVHSDDKQSMRLEIDTINEKLQGFVEVFEKRREAIAGLVVE
jgi:DNA repair exonuclease SbcCD ATPase subunit